MGYLRASVRAFRQEHSPRRGNQRHIRTGSFAEGCFCGSSDDWVCRRSCARTRAIRIPRKSGRASNMANTRTNRRGLVGECEGDSSGQVGHEMPIWGRPERRGHGTVGVIIPDRVHGTSTGRGGDRGC